MFTTVSAVAYIPPLKRVGFTPHLIIRKVTMLGHKDHGKSTLLGSLLIATKAVSEERIAEARRISKELGRDFEPGFILDAFSEEREGGLTIDTTRAELKYKGVGFEFIDVPGHEELIKNMLTGASNANTALLVVSAMHNEGITDQTKRHLFIAKMLGISNIVVAVNKMDAVKYDKTTFSNITNDLSKYFEAIGFPSHNVSFVPISAYDGDNLIRRSKSMAWYKGPPLMDLVLRASEPAEKKSGRLRVVLQGRLGEMVTGRVVSGVLKRGFTIAIYPRIERVIVPDIVVAGRKRGIAKAGENIAVKMSINGQPDGRIGCSAGDRPMVAKGFDAMIFITAHIKGRIRIVINGASVAAAISKIRAIDTSTGMQMRGKPGTLDAAYAEIRLAHEVAFERFSEFEELGRFTIYNSRGFAGFGIVV